jgi:hypothetical protein
MNRSNRTHVRQEYERRRREAVTRRAWLNDVQARAEVAAREALSRSSRGVRSLRDAEGLASTVFRRAPRLAVEPFAGAVVRLAALPTARPLSAWSPSGKGRTRLFRSLGEHALASYPVPALLWDGFFDADADRFVPLVAHVAAGEAFTGT